MMNNADRRVVDLAVPMKAVVDPPAPDTCAEIEALLFSLPLYSSFINLSEREP